jgi:hypothetical protein
MCDQHSRRAARYTSRKIKSPNVGPLFSASFASQRSPASHLENGTCKVDTRVHNEPALSQFYRFDADFAAFSSNFSSSFYGGEIQSSVVSPTLTTLPYADFQLATRFLPSFALN